MRSLLGGADAPLHRVERRSAHLVARELRKGFGEGVVLDGISLTVSAGQCLAVVGDNGAGKSTLLRLLAGTLPPDAGSVMCTTTRTLVEQELETAAGSTVAEIRATATRSADEALTALEDASVALADDHPDAAERYAAALQDAERLDAWDAQRRLTEALDAFGATFPDHARLHELSVGQRYRLRLACALFDPTGAILLDEPSNHLDDQALDHLTERLQAFAGIVVLVTHDRWLLDAVATSLPDLDPTAGTAGTTFAGGYRAYRRARARTLADWQARYANSLQAEAQLERQLDEARAATPQRWRPGKGAAKHDARAGPPAQSGCCSAVSTRSAGRGVPRPQSRWRSSSPSTMGRRPTRS